MKGLRFIIISLLIMLTMNIYANKFRIENKVETGISNKVSIFTNFLNEFDSGIDYKEIDVGFVLKDYTVIISKLELFSRTNLLKLDTGNWERRRDVITGISLKGKWLTNRFRIKYIDSDYFQYENEIKIKKNNCFMSSEFVYNDGINQFNKIKYKMGYSNKLLQNIVYGIAYRWDFKKINSSWEHVDDYFELQLGLRI